MTTPPTPDAGGIDEPRVITALHLLRDLGFTALYDAEERPAADIADILDAWATLTAQLAAAKAVLSKLNEGGSDDVRIAVRNAIFSAGGSFLNLCDSGELIDAAMKAARTGAR